MGRFVTVSTTTEVSRTMLMELVLGFGGTCEESADVIYVRLESSTIMVDADTCVSPYYEDATLEILRHIIGGKPRSEMAIYIYDNDDSDDSVEVAEVAYRLAARMIDTWGGCVGIENMTYEQAFRVLNHYLKHPRFQILL